MSLPGSQLISCKNHIVNFAVRQNPRLREETKQGGIRSHAAAPPGAASPTQIQRVVKDQARLTAVPSTVPANCTS